MEKDIIPKSDNIYNSLKGTNDYYAVMSLALRSRESLNEIMSKNLNCGRNGLTA